MKKYKILYWNIHYEDGRTVNKINIDNATKTVIDNLDEYIEDKEINVIVLTEAYPQVNANNLGAKANDEILTHYNDKFDVFPYEPSKDYVTRKFECNYPFAKLSFHNSVIIMTRKDLKFKVETINNISVFPNLLSVENDSIQIIGLRFCQDGDDIIKQIEKIKGIIKCNKPILILGDYNPSLVTKIPGGTKKLNSVGIFEIDINSNDGISHIYDQLFEKCCGIKKCVTFDYNEGTNVNIKGEDTFPDKLSICNVDCDFDEKNVIRERLKTAEEVYFDEKCIDKNTGHVRGNIEDGSLKEKYIEWGFEKLKYGRAGLNVKSPFPDHNLMYVSIEI